jgi:transaldolase/glucose-6-phosphate isomerase
LTSLDTAVQTTLAKLDEQKFCQRLWERDASLWKREPEHQRVIRNTLGWLNVPLSTLGQVDEILKFVEEVRAAGFRHAVVLGMGGSSLCPDVCRATFGTAPGFLELQVLDSTVPASVARLEKSLDAARTLFLVSSKSGGTAETTSFYKYFYDRVRSLKGERAGENFVAITDPGTSLEKLAQERRFRRVFHGQPDIGGRFSALSNFGMVPAALAGVDVRVLLASATEPVRLCSAGGPARDNPAVWLGVVLAEAARLGRDKITFVISPRIETFADWAEQLIAESTGKEGKGLVPVAGEALGEPAAYGNDRLFAHIKLASQTEDGIERKLQALEAAGHPVIRIELQDVLELGREFFRWEVATATAGALLGINPFDQPNVQESKDNTNRLLAQFRAEGKFVEDAPVVETEGIGFYCDAATRSSLERMIKPRAITDYLKAFLGQARPGDYVALLPYLEPSSEHKGLAESIRLRLRDSLQLATTVGFGPRYLHSTGQLHKGGAANGLFIQVTADDSADLAVPGEPYGFSVLKQAQAMGDFQSLEAKGRRVVRFHLGKSVPAGLERLADVVGTALKEIMR